MPSLVFAGVSVVSLVLSLVVPVSGIFSLPSSCACRGLTTDVKLVESPANKWPDVFGKIPLFVNYPYLLPTSIAACVTLTGALQLSLVSYDVSSAHIATQVLSYLSSLARTVARARVLSVYPLRR